MKKKKEDGPLTKMAKKNAQGPLETKKIKRRKARGPVGSKNSSFTCQPFNSSLSSNIFVINFKEVYFLNCPALYIIVLLTMFKLSQRLQKRRNRSLRM